MSSNRKLVQSLTDKLLLWSSKAPTKQALNYLDDQGGITKSLSYADLLLHSRAIACYLLDMGVRSGDRVLLVFPPSLDFIVAFLACIQVGIIAVPTFPPDPSKLNKDLVMFATIASSCEAKIALTSTGYNFATKLAGLKNALSGTATQWPELEWIVTDLVPTSALLSSKYEFNPIPGSHTAFLQYTSGSTSEPKGVMITHENLAHNLHLIVTGLKADSSTVVVSWLPQYHDMGLIGSYLGVLYCGGSGYYMSPFSFIRNPSLWIHCISKFRGTHMQAPDFAYSLTARKFLALVKANSTKHRWIFDELDLSSVRHMINAAEPVEAASIDLFHAVFSKYGLPKGVVFPTYGLAEHTVYVCSNGEQRLVLDKQALELHRRVVVKTTDTTSANKLNLAENIVLMGCGKPHESDSVHLRIIDTEKLTLLAEDRVGEIWVKSRSRAAGYWNLPEKSAEDFNGTIRLDDSFGTAVDSSTAIDDGYLRTGDLGFLHNGELFITGRQKDLIIIRGRNHYPQDIERVCESKCPTIRGGCSAAFSVPFVTHELLVYVAEVSDTLSVDPEAHQEALQQLLVDIRDCCVYHHSIIPNIVLLVKSRTINKTTSGKIARQWVKKSYLSGSLQAIARWDNLDSLHEESFQSGVGGVTRQIESDDQSAQVSTDKIDPTQLPHSEVLKILQRVLSQCLQSELPANFSPSTPVLAFGLDSMRSVQLQTLLEETFTVSLPDELLFDPDVTLVTIVTSLRNGGVATSRPVMYNAWELVGDLRANLTKNHSSVVPRGVLPGNILKKHETKADIDSTNFLDACALQEAALSVQERIAFGLLAISFVGVFFWLPIILYIFFTYLPLKFSSALSVVMLSIGLGYPKTRSWPPAFRTHYLTYLSLKFFSYRVIREEPTEAKQASIYSFHPHGVFPIPTALQTVVNEFIVGESFHTLSASAVFYIPFYASFLKALAYKDISRETFLSTLKAGRSVALNPGGIAEMFLLPSRNGSETTNEEKLMMNNRKGFIKIALETGSPLVPVFTYGHSQTFSAYTNSALEYLSRKYRLSLILFWGMYGVPIPYRVPLCTVLGRAINCPKVENPSAELIHEYYELYCCELQRLYKKYNNTYNWQERKLSIIKQATNVE